MYATQADLELAFGSTNIALWADINNVSDAPTIAARIVWCLEYATALIDSQLVDGPYTVPFTSPYPDLINHICVALAAGILYDGRRITDVADKPIQMDMFRKQANAELTAILNGRMRLPSLESSRNFPGAS